MSSDAAAAAVIAAALADIEDGAPSDEVWEAVQIELKIIAQEGDDDG